MKKIFKIAAYDFRRLIINPITFVVCLIAAISMFALSFIHKIPTEPVYRATTNGSSVAELYENFTSSSLAFDTKASLDQIISQAQNYITTQSDCLDYEVLSDISDDFTKITKEIEKYRQFGYNKYTSDGNLDEIHLASEDLRIFPSSRPYRILSLSLQQHRLPLLCQRFHRGQAPCSHPS